MSPRQSPLCRLLNPPLARLHSLVRHPRTPSFPTSFVISNRLIDQMVPYDGATHVRFLALHWFGEPLLHPQLLELVAYAGERLPGLLRYGQEHNAMRGLTLSTNATLLNEPAAQGLLDSPLTWLGVSVDGSSAETYESLRCGGTFAQVEAGVEGLLRLNAQSQRELPVIAIQVIATESTRPEFARCVERWQALAQGRANVRVELKPYTDWAGQVEAPELCRPDARRGFLYLDCGRLYDTLVIGAGGEIGLCCYDVQAEGCLGNADERTIAEIWQGERLQQLRRKMRWGRLGALPLCANCQMGRKYPSDLLRR